MRTQTEIDNKIAQLQEQIDKGIGRRDILQIQIDILLEDANSEDFEDEEDSWICVGADNAQQWLDGDDTTL